MTKVVIDENLIIASKADLGSKFLAQAGLNVGDVVSFSFMNFHGTGKNCYQGLKTCKAEIKKRVDGTIYIQSIEPCKNAFEKWNGRFGRQRNTYWEFEEVFPCKDLIDITTLGLDLE